MSEVKKANTVAKSQELFQTYNWYEKQECQQLAIEPIVWNKSENNHSNQRSRHKRRVYRVEKQNAWTHKLFRTCGYVLLILKALTPGAAFKRSSQVLVFWTKRNG